MLHNDLKKEMIQDIKKYKKRCEQFKDLRIDWLNLLSDEYDDELLSEKLREIDKKIGYYKDLIDICLDSLMHIKKLKRIKKEGKK